MPSAPATTRVPFAVAMIGLTLIISMAGVEIAARVYGHRPRRLVPRPEPVMHTADPVLGWTTVPGTYQLGPYTPDGEPITMTIRADGARVTGGHPAPGSPELLLVGCSFTVGWAVADDETWGARIQQARPDLDVVNRGVAGYGTFQALLLLERLFANGEHPARVLFGDIAHDQRNVGSLTWLAMLAGTRSTVATPYCTLRADGSIVRHPPQQYPSLPLHAQLASMALLENAWARWRVSDRATTSPRKLTEELLVEMAQLCRRAGVEFSVVILTLEEHASRARVAFGQRNDIDVIDCNEQLSPALTVPGEGHPNAEAHRHWGACVTAALNDPARLPSSKEHVVFQQR